MGNGWLEIKMISLGPFNRDAESGLGLDNLFHARVVYAALLG